MPARDRFRSAEAFSAALAHELIHWSGTQARLDRDLSMRFVTRAYAAEARSFSLYEDARLVVAGPEKASLIMAAGWPIKRRYGVVLAMP